MSSTAGEKKSGGCPFHKKQQAAAAAAEQEATPGNTGATAATPAGKCPVAHGSAAAGSGAKPVGKCPVAHGGAAAGSGAKPVGKCPVAHGEAKVADKAAEVDVHDAHAPEAAAEAVKAYFAANYNDVASNGTQTPSKARIVLAQASMKKMGYPDRDLQVIGDDVTLMQGVGYPHKHAQYEEGNVVVDLGSGMGIDTRLAASYVGPTGRAIGIDLSEGEVMVSLMRAKKHSLTNVDYRVADMEQLPFGNSSVDRIISNGGFCLVPNKLKAFAEIFRVLTPGGRISISCTTRKKQLAEGVRWPVCMNTFMMLDSIVPLLTELGYEDVFVDTSDSLMNYNSPNEDDIQAAAKAAGTCTHAIRAQMKRKAEAEAAAAATEAGAGAGAGAAEKPADEVHSDPNATAMEKRVTVHKGSAEFAHLKNYNMNDLCARVVIVARKPLATATTTATAGIASSQWVTPAVVAAVAGVVGFGIAKALSN